MPARVAARRRLPPKPFEHPLPAGLHTTEFFLTPGQSVAGNPDFSATFARRRVALQQEGGGERID
jgi:hypothetical protein